MFKLSSKSKKEKAVTVRTKEELKAALKRKEPLIEVKGKLAKDLKWIVKLSTAKIAALIVALGVLTIGTGGSGGAVIATTNYLTAQAAVSSVTGTEVAGIIFASGLALSTIIAVLKGYTVTAKHGDTSLVLERKR